MYFDEEHRYPDITRSSRYPVPALIAGVIWIVIGTLLLLSSAGCLGLLVVFPPRFGRANADWISQIAVLVGCLLFGLVFLVAGIQTVRGGAGGTLGTGVMSVIVGVLLLGGAALIVIGGVNQRRDEMLGRIMGAGMISILALIFLTAGILAISAAKRYRSWRDMNRQRSIEW